MTGAKNDSLHTHRPFAVILKKYICYNEKKRLIKQRCVRTLCFGLKILMSTHFQHPH